MFLYVKLSYLFLMFLKLCAAGTVVILNMTEWKHLIIRSISHVLFDFLLLWRRTQQNTSWLNIPVPMWPICQMHQSWKLYIRYRGNFIFINFSVDKFKMFFDVSYKLHGINTVLCSYWKRYIASGGFYLSSRHFAIINCLRLLPYSGKVISIGSCSY